MMRTLTRTCEALDYCAHWYGPDRDCGQLTASHSAFCEDHADHDDEHWHATHDTDDCCPECCGEDGCHE